MPWPPERAGAFATSSQLRSTLHGFEASLQANRLAIAAHFGLVVARLVLGKCLTPGETAPGTGAGAEIDLMPL